MASAYEIKKELCDIGRRIYARTALWPPTTATFSVKMAAQTSSTAPRTGASKGYMTPDMILKVDGRGQHARAQREATSPPPSSKCTCGSTRSVPTSTAVVHAHPPVATALAVLRHAARYNTSMPEAIICPSASVPV